MVDFNTETAINTPAKSIEGVLLLEKREAFLSAKEQYCILLFQGSAPPCANMRARLLNIIDQWEGFLNRQKEVPFKEWIKALHNNNVSYEEIMDIFYKISELMDKSNLTKIDREVYDRTNIELENDNTGLD